MANLFAIHSVGASLMTYLRNAYPEPLRSDHPCDFRLLSSAEIDEAENIGTAITLYLYRVTTDEHLRNLPPQHRPNNSFATLSLNVHFLISVWADSALAEHTIMGWVMSELNQHPILDSAKLSPEASWRPDEQVQFMPVELSTGDMMCIWNTLSPNYRLSKAYVACVARIDPMFEKAVEPVVVTRYQYSEKGAYVSP